MSVMGVSMVKDEMDILPWTLPRMLSQLDHVIVADNMSSDGTYEYLRDLSGGSNLTVVRDEDVAFFQSEKMSALARMAASKGADWVVPFDSDEVWVSPSGPLSEVLPEYAKEGRVIVEALLYDYVPTGVDDLVEPDPIRRIVHRRDYHGALPKVACQTLPGLVIEQGNHGAHYPGPVTRGPSNIIICHYPYRSVEQMARKARNGAQAYRAAGDRLSEDTGRHWRDYGRFLDTGGIEAIEEIFKAWFYAEDPATEGLVLMPCPI